MTDCVAPLWRVFALTAMIALGIVVGLSPLWGYWLWQGRRDEARWDRQRAEDQARMDEQLRRMDERHEAAMRRMDEGRTRGWE
jgi:hypothetical protein